MTLRSAYRTAITMHDIELDLNVVINATKQMIRLGFAAKSQERDRRVSDEEIDAICTLHESLLGTVVPLRIITAIAVALPRRREELLTMRWEHYKNGEIKLFDTKDPNKLRDEIIPVPPAAQEILAKLPKQTEGRILPYVASSVSGAFIKMASRRGLPPLHFHDLRHEGISRLFAQGLNIPEVSLISGHTSWATLKRYTHLKPSDVLEKLRASSQTTKEVAP
jgi:integrase